MGVLPTHCPAGDGDLFMGSGAKNLVHVRDATCRPRSFAALRMTTFEAFGEKIDSRGW